MYSYRVRYLLLGLLIALCLLGIASNPVAYWEGIKQLPVTLAIHATWLVAGLALIWIATDLVAKYLLGTSLRELIEKNDPTFAQYFIIALVIAIPIIAFAR